MQFSKIAISTAFVAAAFSSAAPVASSQQETEVVDKRAPLNPLVLAGGAGLLTSFLGSKEGQQYANSKEGQEFLSKAAAFQSRDVEEESAEKRLNPAFMIGSAGGSILSSIFGSKEAADDFINKLQAAQNSNSTSQSSNSTSGIQARGSKTDIGGLVAAGLNLLNTIGARDVDEESAEKRLNPAFLIGSAGGSVLSSIFGSKEAADEFINNLQASQNSTSTTGVQARGSKTDIGGLVAAGLNLLNTLGARDVDEEVAEKRLNPLVLAGGAGLLTSFLGSKEGQQYANSKEGQEFLSKAASLQSRDFEERGGKLTFGGAGAGLNIANAILNLLPTQGSQKREVEEFEERAGKVTFGGAGAGLNIANALLNLLPSQGSQKRDVDVNANADLLGGLLNGSLKVDA